jgi:hypothetical protein
MSQKLEIVNTWNLKYLIEELENGNIKIPKFQRDYVWEKTKVLKLLNSIYNQYPIGTLFFWIAPKEYSGFIRENMELGIVENSSSESVQFIIDGQQRLISLFVSLKGKNMNGIDYSTICFNPTRKEFVIPRSKNDKRNIPVCKLFDDNAYSVVYEELMSKDTTKSVANNWKECRDIFINYPISVIKTINNELEDVVEIFERINQSGKHLTVFDLIHATTWSDKFDLKDKISEFNTIDRQKTFGVLSNKVFVLSLTLDVFDDARTLYQLRLSPEQCKNIWPRMKTALISTLDFFKQIRVTNDLSSYYNVIPIIQYYFYKSGLKTIKLEHQKEIEKWFWDTKFSKRYASSVYTRMKEDISWISSLLDE